MPDGTTRRQNLESAERQRGMRPAELDKHPCPAWAAYLWEWWYDLHRGRASSGYGPLPLPHSEILAWSRLTGRFPLLPAELAAIRLLDEAWLDHRLAQQSKD